jgi:hypothetical protein
VTNKLPSKICMPPGEFDNVKINDTFEIEGVALGDKAYKGTMKKHSETIATADDRIWEYKTEGQEYFKNLVERR